MTARIDGRAPDQLRPVVIHTNFTKHAEGSVLIEVHDEWQVAERRYLSEGSMAKIYETDNDDKTNKEVGANSKELLAG